MVSKGAKVDGLYIITNGCFDQNLPVNKCESLTISRLSAGEVVGFEDLYQNRGKWATTVKCASAKGAVNFIPLEEITQ